MTGWPAAEPGLTAAVGWPPRPGAGHAGRSSSRDRSARLWVLHIGSPCEGELEPGSGTQRGGPGADHHGSVLDASHWLTKHADLP